MSMLQTIVSRTLDPLDSGVVSVTQFHAGKYIKRVVAMCICACDTRRHRHTRRHTQTRNARTFAGRFFMIPGTAHNVIPEMATIGGTVRA